MRLAIIETDDDRARVLLELSEEDFLKRLKEAYLRYKNIEQAFKEVADYLKKLTVNL
jgi:hypothetical protein